jgi:transposase
MSARFVNVDRQTPMLLPVDMREWVRGDDLAHFVLEAVEGMESEMAVINHRGSGSEQYPPTMMMGLLLYCYAQGIFSSRRIEAATYTHLSVRYLAGNTHPDHDTIATFRRVNGDLVRGSFVRVLELAREVGLLRLGTIAVDGTKLWANAAKRRTLSEVQLQEQEQLLEREVEQLLEKAERADAQDSGEAESLPRELSDRAQRQAKLQAARVALAERREQRVKRAALEREQALAEGCDAPRRVPEAQLRAKESVNLTDPQSVLQPTPREGFIQGYNAQAALSTESGLIVSAQVVTDTSDRRQLAPTIAAIPSQFGAPQVIVADTGYDNAAQILHTERTTGATVYCAAQKISPTRRAHQCWRKSQRRTMAARLRLRMEERLRSEEGRRLYALRRTSVEPTFGMLKSVLGFRRFHLRGLEKVNIEWQLVSAALNCRRLARRVRRN